MIVGCGIDTEEIKRFDKHLADIKNSGFVKMVYTKREIENYGNQYRKYIPVSFCCKEAVFKAIGDSWTTSPVHWQDIEFILKPGIQPGYEIRISGHAKKILNNLNNPKVISEFQLSDENATFYVILTNE